MGLAKARRYPVGIQSFEKLRQGRYLYVDKTQYVYKLAHGDATSYFLSRPRRFGKSLLLSTMQAYFEGRRDLFEGLAINELESAWEQHPVLRFDLSVVKATGVSELRQQLDDLLSPIADRFDCPGGVSSLGGRLSQIIERAHRLAGARAVVLVDEYDAPLLNVIDGAEQLEAFRMVMREFFIPLKAMDDHLRFVFLTGITKFSQLSIFSELNNLVNISMDPAYAGVCGITEQELDNCMSSDVEALASELGVGEDEARLKLKEQYDGYHFADQSPDVYNPYSLLSAFSSGRIGSYWFGSGTPTALIHLLREHRWEMADLESCDVLESEFDAPTETAPTPLAMLYQAGYLTIKAYDPESGVYALGIPNREVSRGLSESMVLHVDPQAQRAHNSFLIGLARDLRAGDLDRGLQRMRSYLAGIPYHLGSRDERGFETTFYLIFDLLGIQIDTEFKMSTGRIDAVVKSADTIYVLEFKYGRSAAEALEQVDSKGYLIPFKAKNRQLVKAGVNFSPEEQTIDDWIIREA